MGLNVHVEALSGAPLFAGVPAAKVRLMACMSEELEFQSGEFVFRTGEHADAVYLVLEGEVEFLLGDPADGNRLTTVKQGEMFGEVSILAGEDRHASARALTKLKVMRLGGECFFRMLNDHGIMALTVAKNLAKRLARLADKQEMLFN